MLDLRRLARRNGRSFSIIDRCNQCTDGPHFSAACRLQRGAQIGAWPSLHDASSVHWHALDSPLESSLFIPNNSLLSSARFHPPGSFPSPTMPAADCCRFLLQNLLCHSRFLSPLDFHQPPAALPR